MPSQFSLRAVFVVLTVLCLCTAVAGYRIGRIAQNQRAIVAVASAGGQLTSSVGDEMSDQPLPTFWKQLLGLSVPPSVASVYWECADVTECRSTVPLLARFSDLQRLEVAGEWWNDECSKSVCGLNSLTWVNVGGSELTSRGIALLVRPHLDGLWVSAGDLEGLEAENIVWPSSLTSLNLEGCEHLSTSALIQISHAEALEDLYVDGASLLNSEMEGTASRSSIVVLSIVNCTQLSSRGLTALVPPQLIALRISDAVSLEGDLEELTLPSSLRRLTISGLSHITTLGADRIVRMCPDLEQLTLSSPHVDEAACASFRQLTKCRWLDLRGTNVGPESAAALNASLGGKCTVLIGQDRATSSSGVR